MQINTNGGYAIASGGFGCVFYPALKCANHANRDKSKISKLLTRQNAINEYNEIKSLIPLLKQIHNYSNFFIVENLNICKPDKLSDSDLIDYNKRCSSLTKTNINNINSSLNNFLILNIPYGGITINNFIFKNYSYTNFIKLNNSLINLLLNGIIPMNKLNVYHCDIKDSNIVIDINENTLKPKLIDWGNSIISEPLNIPKHWINRPLQFNVPFSIIILSPIFFKKLHTFINSANNSKQKTLNEYKEFMKDFLVFFLKNGLGHYTYIQYVFSVIFNNKHKKKYNNIIINYNADILFNYLNNNKTTGINNLLTYFKVTYKKNVDIWGFVFTYFPVLEVLHKNQQTLSLNEKKVLDKLKQIFINYLYNTTNEINVIDLINDLTNLDDKIKTHKRINIKNNY
jgi:hypothetical protein